MFRGKRTPDDLTYIDSTDNAEQRAVKSAWNLNRYGTTWSELLKAVEKAKDDEFVDDSLEYLYNLEPWYTPEQNPGRTFKDEDRQDLLVEGYLIPSKKGPYYIDAYDMWPGTEHAYFDYLDSIADHPIGSKDDTNPIDERAKAYQRWKKMKYGK